MCLRFNFTPSVFALLAILCSSVASKPPAFFFFLKKKFCSVFSTLSLLDIKSYIYLITFLNIFKGGRWIGPGN